MNRLMKGIVEVAFRVSAMERERSAARKTNKRPPPHLKTVVAFVRGMCGVTEPPSRGGILDDVTDAQHHAIVRAGVTLDWFARAGCPIVSLDDATARGFAESDPPDEDGETEWPLGVTYGLSIGQAGAVLVRHAMLPSKMPEKMREHFPMVDGGVAMEAWIAGVVPNEGEDALANLTSNVGATLLKRPDGLAIEERHPSRRAARKKGLDPTHLPGVEYVIGTEMLLGKPRASQHASDGGEAEGWSMQVQTVRSPHWTHQVWGPRGSLRRLQWLTAHWMGPPGAPVSVHAARIVGTEKGPPERRKK